MSCPVFYCFKFIYFLSGVFKIKITHPILFNLKLSMQIPEFISGPVYPEGVQKLHSHWQPNTKAIGRPKTSFMECPMRLFNILYLKIFPIKKKGKTLPFKNRFKDRD